jgi:hypothetical protein
VSDAKQISLSRVRSRSEASRPMPNTRHGASVFRGGHARECATNCRCDQSGPKTERQVSSTRRSESFRLAEAWLGASRRRNAYDRDALTRRAGRLRLPSVVEEPAVGPIGPRVARKRALDVGLHGIRGSRALCYQMGSPVRFKDWKNRCTSSSDGSGSVPCAWTTSVHAIPLKSTVRV